MYKLFRMELLKSKRTLLRPVLFIGAVIFAVLLMIVANLAPDTLENSWEHYTKMIFNMWTISFNTLGISLLCILSEYEEKKNNTYRSIYVEAFSETGLDSKSIYFSILLVCGYCTIDYIRMWIGIMQSSWYEYRYINIRNGWNYMVDVIGDYPDLIVLYS